MLAGVGRGKGQNALRSVHLSVADSTTLVLLGDTDLVPIAQGGIVARRNRGWPRWHVTGSAAPTDLTYVVIRATASCILRATKSDKESPLDNLEIVEALRRAQEVRLAKAASLWSPTAAAE